MPGENPYRTYRGTNEQDKLIVDLRSIIAVRQTKERVRIYLAGGAVIEDVNQRDLLELVTAWERWIVPANT